MERIRPGLLTFVCITAMALGVLGLLSAAMNAATLFAGAAISEAATAIGTVGQDDPATLEAYQDMQAQILAVTEDRKPTLLAIHTVHLVVALGLLLAGGFGFRMTPRSRSLIAGSFAAAIVFELIRIVPTVAIQLEVLEISKTFIAHFQELSSESEAAVMGATLTASSMVGIAFPVLFLVLKVAFYGFGIVYVGRKKELFTT